MRTTKTKALISFAVTAKLICVFVFLYAKSRFSHDAALFITDAKLILNSYSVIIVMRKPAFCICENKDADQRLCFCYIASTIPLLPKYIISSHLQ